MAETADPPQQKCPACGTLVDVSDAEPLARVACPGCGEKIRVERAFDNFVLVETLGVGGMGSVYKARDTRLDRFVALKVLRKELSADPAEAARLEHEARVTAAVNHPNVVQVYSAGSAHGQIYLVMELVDHGSLDDLMAQLTHVPEGRVLEAGIQVARGLQAAQAKGLIHRDVKPANILFSEGQTAKIGDFGLAGAAEQKEARNEIWGTPYYVAPERLNNEPEDFRSDIFSLGATLFHALAGKPPIEGETTSASELRKLKSHPPDLRAVAPDVSRETARVIDRMLAPDPANRFSSYGEVVEHLLGAYRALPGGPGDGGSRKRWLVISAAVVIAGLIGAGIFLYQKQQRAASSLPSAPSTPPPKTEDNSGLQRRFDEARHLIVEEKYDQATTALTKLAIDLGNRQPMQNWSRLHIGLAAQLQRKPGPARDAFQQVERAGEFSKAKNDEELVRFFVETSRALVATGPVRASVIGGLNPKGVNALALLLYGLKDWQLNEFAEAATLLEKYGTSELPNEWKWIGEYKPIAQKFLADYRLYAEWKQQPPNPVDAGNALTQLKALEGKLQTRGPLADSVKEEEKRLTRELGQREKEEKEKQAEERKRAFANDRVRYLSEWKKQLVADLKTGAFKGKITINVTEYLGASTATESEIKLRVGQYGEAPFSWDKFPPSVLLGMSTAFIKPEAADAADRQWLAAVYAASTNQMSEAKSLADAAAKAKAEYAPRRDLLFSAP